MNPSADNSVIDDNNYLEKPRYIKAITQNNSPRYDWGPKKRINHYGLYAHLSRLNSDGEIALNRLGRSGANAFINQNFQGDNNSNKGIPETLEVRF
jgi:hypothetical protein